MKRRRGHCGLVLGSVALVVVVGLIGCDDDPFPVTTEADRMYFELEDRISVGMPDTHDLTLVLEPDERAAVADDVLALVREIITGDLDGDAVADQFAFPLLRIAVVSAADNDALTIPCNSEYECNPWLRVATYHWYPYGFAEDPSRFFGDLRCLLAADNATCPTDDDSDAGLLRFDAFPALSFTRAQLADTSGESLLQYLRDHIAGDYGPWSPGAFAGFDRVLLDDDGRTQCNVREVLPTVGSITRCDQLTNVGRTSDGVTSDGHDICLLEQLAPDHDDAPPTGFGFYYYTGNSPPIYGVLPIAVATPQFPPPFGFISSEGPRLLMNQSTPFVGGSMITYRCAMGAPVDVAP